MRKYFLLFFLVLSGHLGLTQKCNLKKAARQLMGKTISQAIVYLQLDSTNFHCVQEPHAMLRGISGQSNCFMFYLYTDKVVIPLEIDTTGGEWRSYKSKTDLERIKNKKIIGLSLQNGKHSIRKGKTIVYYGID